jgi:hypothetical protein
MSGNGKPQVQAVDPSNPPPGMFMLVIIEKLNEQGQVETTVQGKIDEPYALECAVRGLEVLKIHHAKLKEKTKDSGDMKILGVD